MTEPTRAPGTGTNVMLIGADHVRAYQQTDGAEGYMWNGVPTLLLDHTGRKSGTVYTTPLIFARDGDDYLVVASMGGSPTAPSWYENLVVNPETTIQVKGDHIRVRARPNTDEERPRLWEVVTGPWPNYDVYQSRTERVIPVVVLTPIA